MTDIFEAMDTSGAERIVMLRDKPSGLKAIIVLDSLVLGPACGGIRTKAYASISDALADAAMLAQAMTLKCAITGLAAGGGKTVVIDHPELDRPAAFRALGRFVESLGGLYRCAGDLGTTAEDLANVASETDYCNTAGGDLAQATARTVAGGIRACAHERGIDSLSGLSIAVQGCGLIGEGVARAMAAEGMRVFVADTNARLAEKLAREIGGTAVPADAVLSLPVDFVSPCAIGGVLTAEVIASLQCWAVCGGANNQLNGPEAAELLRLRDIAFVPDFLASSGAVIVGVCGSVMQCDPGLLIDTVQATAGRVLRKARLDQVNTLNVALQLANASSHASRSN